MPPKRAANKPPSSEVENLHRQITVLGENVRSHGKRDAENPAKKVKFVEPVIPTEPAVVSQDLADNPYAEEIFMCKTNIRDVARRAAERNGCETTEKMIRPFRRKLYRLYTNDPKARIREPLNGVRFESQYYEYRFFLALHKPLHSEEQYQEYKEQLEAAGVSESWVCMRKHNRLLKYEDKIVAKLKANFSSWCLKLNKLDYYLMDMHSKQPREVAKPKVSSNKNTPANEDDHLLKDILERSNAKQMLSEAQIRARFPQIKTNLLAPKRELFEWLDFDDDELNKRFKLGAHRTEVTVENEPDDEVPQQESTASSSRPSSVASGDSEIAQMRSEMAMTQPRELLPMEASRFADTEELVLVLGTVEEPPLPMLGTVNEPFIKSNATEESSRELSSMITPAQHDIVEISDSPVDDDDLVEIKEEFIYTLDYMKQFTNIEQHVINEINQLPPRKIEHRMRKLDVYVERYYEYNKSMLLQNVLPSELRMLSRKERRERQANMAATVPNLNRPDVSSTASEVSAPPIQTEISPHTATPSVRRVPRQTRLIVYEDDSDEEQPAQVPEDTLPMPHSEDFLPSIFSTQLPSDCIAAPRRQDTPFQSPVMLTIPQQTPTLSSRVTTPAFESDSLDATVITNKNAKSPQKAPSIKRELNTTSYEGEVEFVEVSNNPIVINDTMDATSQNIPELLERQSSCLAALPDNLRGMVSTLFRENRDTTLSQGSGTSSGSNDRVTRIDSRLSQDTVNTSVPSMGFHQATANRTDLPNSSLNGKRRTFEPKVMLATKSESHLIPPVNTTSVKRSLSDIIPSPSQPFRLVSDPFRPSQSAPSSGCTLRFLTQPDIVTVTFFRNPTVYHQRHHLAVTLNNRGLDGIFRLTIADHEVRKLLNLTGGERGWRALIGALNRVGRFQYDRFRCPSPFQFYQMSISEKILHLFFSTFPDCPRGPGWMLRFDEARNYFEGDGVRLDEFNWILHAGSQGSVGSMGQSSKDASKMDLSEGLDSYVVQRMREEKLKTTHTS